MKILLAKTKERALTLLGALIVLVLIIAVVGGIVYVAKKIIDKLNQIFPSETALSYYYEKYDPSYFYVPGPEAIPINSASGTGGDEVEPTVWWTVYWSEFIGHREDWIYINEVECKPSQIQDVLLDVVKWDVATTQHAKDWSRHNDIYIPQSGFYRAEEGTR